MEDSHAEKKETLEALIKIRNDPKICGKYGLLGDSGLVPWPMPDGTSCPWFVSMSYDAGEGNVFIRLHADFDENKEPPKEWARAKREGADPKDIIRCSKSGCGQPAVRLDHHHPYDDTMTNCEEHMDWPFKGGTK